MRQVLLVVGMLVLGGVLGIAPMGSAQSTTWGVTLNPLGAKQTWANGITGTSAASCGEDDEHEGRAQGKAHDEHEGRAQGKAEADDECDEDHVSNTTPGTSGVQVVGYYYDMGGLTHNYMWTATGFAPIVVPGEIAGYGHANGINKAGHVVGMYWNMSGQHGFLLVGGTLTTLDFPGAAATEAVGINATDQVVGTYYDQRGLVHGFLWTGGTSYTPLDFPGAFVTMATGINDAGQIVGAYSSNSQWQGWLRSGGAMSPITVSGAVKGAIPHGINTSGQVVGEYTDLTRTHGFKLVGGVVTTVDVPGSVFTAVNGISDAGEMVGEYKDVTGAQLGFKMP